MGRPKHHPARLYQVIGEPGSGACFVGYVRYSMELQDEATIATQKRKITEFAAKHGWLLVAWYEEPAHSAKYDEIAERPVFAQLLHDAGKQFQGVLCYHNNRWARNVTVAYASLTQLRRKRVWWATADGQWDIDKVQQDGFDVAFVVDTQLNAAFSRQLSRRIIDGKEDRALDGYPNGKVSFGYLPPDYQKAPDGAPSTWKPPRTPVRIDPVTFPSLVRIGELAAQGWVDDAIAHALGEVTITSPRFGQRLLTKDTIAAIRRSWFPREFAPGCGHGTIETPSGELAEGRHPAAWPYALWQRMLEVKATQYRRPMVEWTRRAHEFSRIVVCAACRRPLRVTTGQGMDYYKDTSSARRLPCTAYGCLTVKSGVLLQQFGELLASITLPEAWREAIRHGTQGTTLDREQARIEVRRRSLEAEQQRLVLAFTKGYLSEADLDAQIAPLRAELLTLPQPVTRDRAETTRAVIEAGEVLLDLAGYWGAALIEERRDIVGAMLCPEGLIYDLERQAIVGLVPRPDVAPVLALGLQTRWEAQADGRIRLVPQYLPPPIIRTHPHQGYRQPKHLSPEQEQAVLDRLRAGQRPRRVAKALGVSYWAIWRLMERELPPQVRPGQPRALTVEQAAEAQQLLAQGRSLREVARHFGVSHSAIWRLAKQVKEGGEG